MKIADLAPIRELSLTMMETINDYRNSLFINK